jgi:DNA (cytosine-5)-methyltransferase 1
MHMIEAGGDCQAFLAYLVQGLILKRNQQLIRLAKPVALSIATISQLLDQHFQSRYAAEGASRLPVLAIYAAYQCMMGELRRFEGKRLLPLESHTSADARSGRIGDIDIHDDADETYEALEIKHNIKINALLVRDAREKLQTTQVKRYYLLSTANYPDDTEMEAIHAEINRIKHTHGCEFIVNGVLPSIRYYLRLLEHPADFIKTYVALLEDDLALKFEHKVRWNALVENLGNSIE